MVTPEMVQIARMWEQARKEAGMAEAILSSYDDSEFAWSINCVDREGNYHSVQGASHD